MRTAGFVSPSKSANGIADALDIPQCVRSGGPHNVVACYGYRRAAGGIEEGARPAPNGHLASRADAAPHDLVPDPTPCGGNFNLGLVLSVAWMHAQRGSSVLFFRCHLYDPWIR